jgi:hypothetical protein
MHYDLDTLDDYLRGELDAATVRDWLRTAAVAEEREFPSLVRAHVWDAIHAAPPARFAWLRSGWRPWVALPVAAAIALAVYAEVPAIHGGAPAGIAATDLLLEHAAQMADNPLADHGVVVRASTLDASEASVPLVEAVDTTSIADPAGDGR